MNIPKGYILVPIVPTSRMLEYADSITPRGLLWGWEEENGNVVSGAALIWSTMIRIALEEGVPT